MSFVCLSLDSLSVGYDIFKYVHMIFMDACNNNCIYIGILPTEHS